MEKAATTNSDTFISFTPGTDSTLELVKHLSALEEQVERLWYANAAHLQDFVSLQTKVQALEQENKALKERIKPLELLEWRVFENIKDLRLDVELFDEELMKLLLKENVPVYEGSKRLKREAQQ